MYVTGICQLVHSTWHSRPVYFRDDSSVNDNLFHIQILVAPQKLGSLYKACSLPELGQDGYIIYSALQKTWPCSGIAGFFGACGQ